MSIFNVLFALLTAGVFGFFAFNLRKTWAMVHIGKGAEDNRFDQFPRRVQEMVTFGFLQQKMFKDLSSGIMHALIFWGFITVSIGTGETLLSGIIPGFTFKWILGEGELFRMYLVSQDYGNTAVAVAILYAFARRLFFPPRRLQNLAKASRLDAYLVLGMILGLVVTTLIYMGAKAFLADSHAIASSSVPISAGIAKAVGGIFGVETPAGWATFSKSWWLVHCLILFSFTTFLPYSKHQHLIWSGQTSCFVAIKAVDASDRWNSKTMQNPLELAKPKTLLGKNFSMA